MEIYDIRRVHIDVPLPKATAADTDNRFPVPPHPVPEQLEPYATGLLAGLFSKNCDMIAFQTKSQLAFTRASRTVLSHSHRNSGEQG